MDTRRTYEIELKDRQHEYLERMRDKHEFPDLSKTLRVLIDFAMHEREDEERIFTKPRCSGC